jgi:hypothetical protein
MKKYLFILVITLGAITAGYLLLTYSCKNTEQKRNYFPLAKGLVWKYKILKDNKYVGAHELKIISEKEGIFKLEADEYRLNDTTGNLYCKSKAYNYARYLVEDVLEIGEMHSNGSKHHLILQKPYEVGKTWVDDPGSDYTRYTILSNDLTYSTPLGTFNNCLKINFGFHDATTSFYAILAPNTGIIAIQTGETYLLQSFGNQD